LRTYSRVQAFSDTTLIVGAYNREFTLSVAIPQDFTNSEDIESLLAGLQAQDQILTDAEGAEYQVRVTHVSDAHLGGQPEYYTADLSMTAINNIKVSLPIIGDSGGTMYDSQIKVHFANGYYWAFFPLDSSNAVYSSSSDGITWSMPRVFATGINGIATPGFNIATWLDGTNTIYYMVSLGDGSYHPAFGKGTLNSNGTITWLTQTNPQIGLLSAEVGGYLLKATNGHLYYIVDVYENDMINNANVEVWTSTNDGVTWSHLWHYNFGTTQMQGNLYQFQNGHLALVFLVPCIFNPYVCNAVQLFVQTSTDGGVTWSSWVDSGFTYNDGGKVGLTVNGNTIYASVSDSVGNLYLTSFTDGAGSWTAPTSITTNAVWSAISSDNTTNLVIYYTDGVSNVYGIKSNNLGATWGTPVLIANNQVNPIAPTMCFKIVGSKVFGIWTTGTGPEYRIRFASVTP